MRTKEEAHDYRYFPDPDLLPLEVTPAYVEDLKGHLPELPDEKKARFMRDFALSAYDAGVLVAERETADYFEAVAKGRDAKAAANWVINELFGRLNKEGKDIASSPVSAEQLGELLDLIADGTISGKIAKDLFEILWNEGGDPRAIVEQRGMKQVTDLGAIEKTVDEIIAKNPDKVADAKSNPKAIGWFVGQVMKASGGKASPQAVNEILKKKLGTLTRARVARACIRFGCSAAIARRVFARRYKNFAAKRVRRDASARKISAPVTARDANHPALIRSFFARFRSAHTVCAAICENYFCLCRCRRSVRCRCKT